MLESLSNKVADLKADKFIKKKTPRQVFLCGYCEIFQEKMFIQRNLGGSFCQFKDTINPSELFVEKRKCFSQNNQ